MMTKKLVLFILAFLLWLLLAWPWNPNTGQIKMENILAGLLAAALVTLVMREFPVQSFWQLLNPVRYFWLAVYVPVFCFYMVRANLDVAYRILHPRMPIHPGTLKLKSYLKTPAALTFLANSITLIPGTLTVDAREDGTFYVHWINITTTQPEEARKKILAPLEWFIQRIFE